MKKTRFLSCATPKSTALRSLKDNLYKHIGPELWKNETFKFKNDFNDISELENVVFIPSTANQIIFDNYEKKRYEIIKNYNDNLKIKDNDDYVFILYNENDNLSTIKSALNKSTQAKYYLRYLADNELINNLILILSPIFFYNGIKYL